MVYNPDRRVSIALDSNLCNMKRSFSMRLLLIQTNVCRYAQGGECLQHGAKRTENQSKIITVLSAWPVEPDSEKGS